MYYQFRSWALELEFSLWFVTPFFFISAVIHVVQRQVSSPNAGLRCTCLTTLMKPPEVSLGFGPVSFLVAGSG